MKIEDNRAPRAKKIEHIAITVSDLQHAKDFFVRYFGCTLGTDYRNPRTGLHSCFVRFDDDYGIEGKKCSI